MRRISHNRPALIAIGIAAVLLVASLTVPAFAGRTAYQALSTKKTAKKALRIARKANSRSKRALAEAKKRRGKTGARGKTGSTGKTGAKGDPGPSASASGSSATTQALGASTEVISAQITTSFQGRILASASAEVSGSTGADGATCWLDSGGDISQRIRADLPPVIGSHTNIAVEGATVKNAGTYTIKLFCANTTGSTTFVQGNLNVIAAND